MVQRSKYRSATVVVLFSAQTLSAPRPPWSYEYRVRARAIELVLLRSPVVLLVWHNRQYGTTTALYSCRADAFAYVFVVFSTTGYKKQY